MDEKFVEFNTLVKRLHLKMLGMPQNVYYINFADVYLLYSMP